MKTLLLVVVLSAAPKTDAKLVGTWTLGGAPFVTFNADGSGTMEDGTLKWSADGRNLNITDDEGTTDKATYQVDDSTMTMNLGGVPMTLTRAEKGSKVKKLGKLAAKAAKAGTVSEADADREAMAQAQEWLARNGQGGQQQPQGQQQQFQGQQQPPAPQQPRGPAGGNDQLARLMTSSAWCYFSYNKISGATNTERFVYSPNGTWSSNSNREALNTGPNGSVYSNGSGGSGGRWQTQNNQLFMSVGDAPMQPLAFTLTQNSNGSPIINAGGREYSMCR